jgi:hypothetical protein
MTASYGPGKSQGRRIIMFSPSHGGANIVVYQPMRGVVDVAQFTFTPAAGAVLADWGQM